MNESTVLSTDVAVKFKRGESPVADTDIILLINAPFFFLQCVFILVESDGYRLVVLHNNRVLIDKKYKTERGVKIAFHKYYGDRSWEPGVKPEWSNYYRPDADWLDDRIKQTGGN